MTMLQKAVIIGTGNVAWQLAHCLPLCGCCVLQIFGRNAHKAESLALEVGAEHTDSYRDIYPNADFYIYAVSDDALPEVVDNVETDAGIHLHTSGSVDIAVFAGKRSNYGVLYPLQTFTRGRMVDFGRVAIFTEANSADNLRRIGEFARRLSLKVFDVDSRQRRRVHLAGVIACNFANYLWQVADDVLHDDNLRFYDVLLPLIQETVDKLKYMSPAEAQTGPAKRGDTQTIARHLDMLGNTGDVADLYGMFSRLILQKR